MNRLKKHWTKEEEDFLREKYLDYNNPELGSMINRTNHSISKRLEILNLVRTKEFIKKIQRDRGIKLGNTPKSKNQRINMGKSRKAYLQKNPNILDGKKNPNWNGGIIYDKGRKLIYSPNHPNPDFLKKYCYEYKLIIENRLGRYLKKGEIVHHINNDVSDNRIKNLRVMTQKEHINLHRKQGDMKKKYKWIIERDSKGRITSQVRGNEVII